MIEVGKLRTLRSKPILVFFSPGNSAEVCLRRSFQLVEPVGPTYTPTYETLGRQFGHGPISMGKCHQESVSQILKFGVSATASVLAKPPSDVSQKFYLFLTMMLPP